MSRLLALDPAQVSAEELSAHAGRLEENFQRRHQVEGIVWPTTLDDPAGEPRPAAGEPRPAAGEPRPAAGEPRPAAGEPRPAAGEAPTRYSGGADSALFTGFYLAAAACRFLATRDAADLDTVLKTLRGVHILTHISGVPGVIARCAFPSAQARLWRYLQGWEENRAPYVYRSGGDVPDVLREGARYPEMVFYTRASRDQLAGILFGLSVVRAELRPERFQGDPELFRRVQEVRGLAGGIAEDLYDRIRANGYHIRDHRGQTGTSAHRVGGLARLQLLALHRDAVRERGSEERLAEADREYERQFRRVYLLGRGSPVDIFNRFSNVFQYYAWNLRFARAYSIFLLESDPRKKRIVARHMRRNLWRHVRSHRNAHFAFLYNATLDSDSDGLEEAVLSLKALSLRPLRSWSSPLHGLRPKPSAWTRLFGDAASRVIPAHLRAPTQQFLWQKNPFSVGEGEKDETGRLEATGVDFLLPYWFGRRHGFIPPPAAAAERP